MAEGGKKLNLDMFIKPIGSVETSKGRVYLYSPTMDNYKFYEDLSEETPENRAQKVMSVLTSMYARTNFSQEFTPIPPDIYSSLAESELSAIVDEFHTKLHLSRRKNNESVDEDVEAKNPDENALAYFDRVLKTEIKYQKNFLNNQRKLIMESVGNPAKKIFEQLNASTARLDDTLGNYERFINSQTRATNTLRTFRPTSIQNDLFEHQQRLNRERKEDQELAKITGQMTAQSAEMLKDLVESAESFLLRFDAKDEKTDKQVSFQLWLGVGSLIVTAFLAVASLIVSIMAFNQDAVELNRSTIQQLKNDQKEKELHTLIKHQSNQIELMKLEQIETNAMIKKLRFASKNKT